MGHNSNFIKIAKICKKNGTFDVRFSKKSQDYERSPELKIQIKGKIWTFIERRQTIDQNDSLGSVITKNASRGHMISNLGVVEVF